MKTYKPLSTPEDSIWDRKIYNPFVLLDRWISKKTRHTWFYWKYERYASEPIYNFINGIKNLWRWLPIVWKDRNWGDNYIFEILKYKLLIHRKHLVKNNRHTCIPETNRDITICLNLIERIQEEYYGIEHMDYKESKFRFEPTGEQFNGENTYIMEEDLVSENFDLYLSKYKSSVRYILKNGYRGRKIDGEDKDVLCLYVAQYNQEKCQKLLFKILNEKINNWWD
jgi:hypothetical protein